MKISLVCAPAWNYVEPSLAIATLQAILKKRGHKVKAFDMSYNYHKKHPFLYNYCSFASNTFFLTDLILPIQDFNIKQIMKNKPDLVAFSVLRTNILPTVKIAKKIKKQYPNIKFIFGGPAVHFKKVRRKLKGIIIDGEADYILPDLLERKKPRKNIINIEKEPVPDFSGMYFKD